jgi:hypothetical protein
MSRGTSRESNLSLVTAPPAVPGSASLSASPQIREPYLYSRPGLSSIDVVAANSWQDVQDLSMWSHQAPGTPAYDSIIETPEQRLGSVQFGQMTPVEIDQARVRAVTGRERNATPI